MPSPIDTSSASDSQTPALPEESLSQPASTSTSQVARTEVFSRRSAKQLSLFLGGAVFFTVAQIITRRSMIRRYQATIPKFYAPSNHPAPAVDGAFEAVEALSIATINVASVGLMMTGGCLWVWDISSLDDMRRKVRGGLGMDESENRESEADKEWEEWMATILARKEQKDAAKEAVKKEGKA